MLLLERIEQKRKCIILIMFVCILVGLVYSLFVVPKEVTAEATLMLIENEQKSESEFSSKGNIDLTKKMISNFEEIIKSESNIAVLNKSLESDININELKNKIQVKGVYNSDTFKIIVQNNNSDLAIKINKELINNFSEKIKTIYTNTEVYIVDSTHIKENTNFLLILKIITISIAIGILLNLVFILVLLEIDKRVKKSNDLESEFALKKLGIIPLRKIKNKLIIENDKTAFSIAFRNLRSNIQFINVSNKEKKTILVTSPKKAEGKTIIASNIAISFAKAGKKVILIDADMKSGNLDKIFNIPNDLGLSNYISGIDENGAEVNDRINKFIKDTTIKNLNVITSGTVPPNSTELLSMQKFEEMIKDLSVFYDILILDGTHVLNETDALILARIANSTIIVSTCRNVKKDDLYRTKRDIQNVGGRIIGIIVNKVRIKEDDEKLYNKTKAFIKEKYLKLKEYIDSKKQKLLDAARIEEKKKSIEELRYREIKLIEEIKKESEEETKPNIFANLLLSINQIKNKVKSDTTVNSEEEKEKEENIQKNEDDKKTVVEENINTSNIYATKDKAIEIGKNIKEKFVNGTLKVNEFIKKETDKVKELKKRAQDKKIEKEKEEVAQEKIKELKEIIKDNEEKNILENTPEDIKLNGDKDENSVLVVVDAENGYCRAFSQYCFTEKLIRGIDNSDGFVKANYSIAFINRLRIKLMETYELTSKQVERIDPLIYTVLRGYDECIWLERKSESNKAEEYAICMAKDYERSDGETKANYELRCQYLRKVELAKAQIEIEYKLDNVWWSNQISFIDKIVFLKFAKAYENLKERRKAEQRENNTRGNLLDGIKNPIELLKKIKIEQVKAKSVEELTKEISESYNKNNFENYQFEEYSRYAELTEQDLEEQRIKQEEQEMLKEQLRIKQELKEKKIQEKAQKREERIRRREENKKNKEIKRQKAKEEARIEEELSEDNLYPKTKYNKYL